MKTSEQTQRAHKRNTDESRVAGGTPLMNSTHHVASLKNAKHSPDQLPTPSKNIATKIATPTKASTSFYENPYTKMQKKPNNQAHQNRNSTKQ